MNPGSGRSKSTGTIVPYEDWMARVLARVEPFAPVRAATVGFDGPPDAAGLWTAEAVTAVWPAPPFTNSAMDGFAAAAADLVGDDDGTVTLSVSADIAAGATDPRCSPGTAARIMTGAPVPEGTDTVVPVEETDHPSAHEPLPGTVTLPANWPVGRNVRVRGTDIAAGAEVMPAGTRLDGAALSALTAVGVLSVPVRPRVKCAVIVTGDELTTLEDLSAGGGMLGVGRILDTNRILVTATLADFGAEVVFATTCSDTPADLDAALARAHTAGADLIVTTGGASVGAHDVARNVLTGFGVEFAMVGIQPGKPQGFGVVDGIVVCALPGNPGAARASLYAIVRPILAKLTGAPVPATVPMTVTEGWSARVGMRQFVPVTIDGGVVTPAVRGGVAAHRVRSLARADGLASVAPDIAEVRPGDVLPVILLRT